MVDAFDDFKRSFFSLAIGPGGECSVSTISSLMVSLRSDALSTLGTQLRGGDRTNDSLEDAALLDAVKVKLGEEWERCVDDIELVHTPKLVEVDEDGVILVLDAFRDVRLYSRAEIGKTTFGAEIPSLENRGVVA